MPRVFLSTLILVLSCITSGAAAQQINEQWLGHWDSSDGQLIVTSKNIVDAGNICKWVGKAPAREYAGCVAFYSGTTTKKEMLATLQTMSIGAVLLPDGRLQFKSDKNISWIMDRK